MKARVVIKSDVMQLDDLHSMHLNKENEKQALYQTLKDQPKLPSGAEIETFSHTLDGRKTARAPAFKNQLVLHKNRSAMDITADDSQR